jgi:tRNA (uracil-5-)-methyltransferase
MPINCLVYCRSFKGADAGVIGRFLQTSLSICLDNGGRPVWISKSRGDRVAKVKFADGVTMGQISELTEGRLKFKEETIKCESINEDDVSSDEHSAKRQKKELSIEEICLPWIHKPYSEQLSEKKQVVVDALSSALAGVKRQAKSRGYLPLPEWPELKILDTIHVDGDQYGYRNKCEFTIGLNSAGIVDVGFMYARATKSLEHVVEQGETLMHVSEKISNIVASFRNFLRLHVEKYCLFSHVSKTGYWRMMSIRSCPITGESQVLVQVGSVESSAEKNDIEELLIEWGKSMNLTSLYIQYNGSLTDTIVMSSEHEMKLILGTESILMGIGNELKLRVHPLSFFQTNTRGCDLLYSTVSEFSQVAKARIFDVCCGVGSIGQYIAMKNGEQVEIVGVDIVEEAIFNAQENAKLNEIETACRYVAGRAENVLPNLIKTSCCDLTTPVCIVDPPRVGLHKTVIKAIRDNEAIKRLIYVSCNPKSMAEDLVQFCEPLSSCPEEDGVAVNARFVPTKAVAVDMFPNTVHCEVVVLLERS